MSEPLTLEEWKRAFHRMAIVAEWPNTMVAPTASTGPNGEAWVPEALDKYDVEANARLILDDEAVKRWNECESYPLRQLLQV